ncbi:hypothetical protein [Kribbella sp.]|uniref:hypothetical protein n=1 Tax=Kribbella sp. TaxID=1871183 RepID=UPI002D471701|nr:hypothetical protein [Kribbella sp.]HZX03651.1 hypothetical protein [Kribbella sp.]
MRCTGHDGDAPAKPEHVPATTDDAAITKCRCSTKFSLPYVVGACLDRGQLTLAEFTEESLTDTAIHAIANRVEIAEDPESRFPEAYSAAVEIALRDGRKLARREAINRGHSERPLTHAEIEEKFLGNVRAVTDESTLKRVRTAVLSLGTEREIREFALDCATSGQLARMFRGGDVLA